MGCDKRPWSHVEPVPHLLSAAFGAIHEVPLPIVLGIKLYVGVILRHGWEEGTLHALGSVRPENKTQAPCLGLHELMNSMNLAAPCNTNLGYTNLTRCT